ncbi:MAG: DUF1800 family protein [Terrimicrobiaceae bacterium]|nr:DUF1800 family protein [Terrimicrobiaceae bacterium]
MDSDRAERMRIFQKSRRLVSAAIALGGFVATPGPIRAADVAFFVAGEKLSLGRTAVIPFQAKPEQEKRIFAATVEPEDAIEILDAPTVLDGERTGFLRVRAVREGKATLRIGKAVLHVTVANDGDAGARGRLQPAITTPADGARVWGRIGVGVEVPATTGNGAHPTVCLRLPDGTELDPISKEASGANSNFTFEVNADALPAGSAKFVAIARGPDGLETESAPAEIVAIRPGAKEILVGNCADHRSVARPRRFGEQEPRIGTAADAPGGKFVDNAAPNPAWCLPVEIKEAGYYQMLVTARGTFAGGAYPSVGLFVDEMDKPATVSQVADREWSRLPLGRPVYLAVGPHVLTPYFLNDFAGGPGVDRNLALASYEIARVNADLAPGDSGANTAPAMMQGGASMMMSAKPQAGGPPVNGTPLAQAEAPRVAFREVFDGAMAAGPVTVRALAWSANAEAEAPRVELWVNGREWQTQQGTELRFRIPPGILKAGENTLQLRSRGPGESMAESPVQHLILADATKNAPAGRILRYTALDAAWDTGGRPHVERADGGALAFFENGEAVLNLPDDLEGAFRVSLEARGDGFNGAPIAEVALKTGGQPDQLISKSEVRGPQTLDAKQVRLFRGPKQVAVRFTNDLYAPEDRARHIPGGDRNLWLKAIDFAEVPRKGTAPAPPTVKISYPADDAVVGGADAVVAQFFSGADCKAVDLIVDGRAQQLAAVPRDGIGPVVLPLLTRGLSPGRHELRISAEDWQKRKCESPEIEFVVSAPDHPVNGPYQRALHLLNRFAYGPEPRELAAILTRGEKEWLRARLEEPFDGPGEQAVLGLLRTTDPDDASDGTVVQRALRQALVTANPVQERFLLWAGNHFSTWIQKAGAQNQWAQHLRFAALGPANFGDLLRASATSPAMLIYLDQRSSFSSKLNENYAREIMELHTLGVDGGYTQHDVTTLAQELNGWTVADLADVSGLNPNLQSTFRFEPRLNDGRARRIFGMEFPATTPDERYDSVAKALELLAAHPSTARFISRKLAEHYVGDPAPPRLVEDLTKVYLESGGDMRAMLEAIAAHPDFWKAPPRVATPLDFSLRFSRLCGAANPGAVTAFLNRSGMGLFERPSPDGYPEADNNYVNSNVLMQRWRFASAVQGNLNQLVPRGWLAGDRANLGRAQMQRAIDLVAARMTGSLLSDASNQAAMDYCCDAGRKEPDTVRLVTSFVAQTPELSLR